MILKFWEWAVILLFGCLTFFHFRGADPVLEENSSFAYSNDERKMLLFIIDFQDFSCSLCLDSFLGLYRKLPWQYRTIQAWGILAVKTREGDETRMIRIAEKKLNGFIQANQITFPFLLDRHRIFSELTNDGSGVLLFDENQQVVFRYDFPLAGEQFEEIFVNLMGLME